MSLSINTNIASLQAQNNLNQVNKALQQNQERLSSGLRINSAADDAAGMAISDRMTAQIRGLNQAVRNANDAISVTSTAEGALQETTDILQRMRELAVQASNDSNTASDRASIQDEVNQLQQEIDRIANNTDFNGTKLLDGTFDNKNFQVGNNSDQTISLSVASAQGKDLGNYSIDTNNTSTVGMAAAARGVNASLLSATGGNMGTATSGNATPYTTGMKALIPDQSITVTESDGTTHGFDIKTTNQDYYGADEMAAQLSSMGGVVRAHGNSHGVKLSLGGSREIHQNDQVSFTLSANAETRAVSLTVQDTNATSLEAQIANAIGTAPGNINVSTENGGIIFASSSGQNVGVKGFSISDAAAITGTVNVSGDGTGQTTTFDLTVGGDNTSGIVFTTGADKTEGAANLAAAIDAKSNITAAASGENITINGQAGDKIVIGDFQSGGAGSETFSITMGAGAGSKTSGDAKALSSGDAENMTATGDTSLSAINFNASQGGSSVSSTTLSNNAALSSDDTAYKVSTLSVEMETGATIESSVTDGNIFGVTANQEITSTHAKGVTDISGGNNVVDQYLTVTGPEGSYPSTAGETGLHISENSSASSIANAVNNISGQTGVEAEAETTATISNLSNDGTINFNLYGSNEDSRQISATITTDNLQPLVDAINDQTGATGISASLTSDGTSVTLTNDTGYDISIENFEHSSATSLNEQTIQVNGADSTPVVLYDGGNTSESNHYDSTVVGGKVTFNSTGNFSVRSDVAAESGGIFAGDSSQAQTGALSQLSEVDVSTYEGSQSAISTIDAAIQQIDDVRGELGAKTNRFDSTINNLNNVVQNVTDARAQIRDADIAKEASEMTMNNVRQQATSAIMTQANQTPQLALQLLGG